MDGKPAHAYVRTRLWGQMFLQFAIQGAYAPVLGRYLETLGLTPTQQGFVLAAGCVAPIILPLIAGQSVDRWFPGQKVLSVCYFLTGGLLIAAGTVRECTPLIWLSFLVAMFFVPTMALANAVSFHHLADARRDFPIVRVGGTLGYIGAGWLLTAWLKLTETYGVNRSLGDSLYLAGIIAFVNAVYCLTLPDTPPKRDAAEKFALGKVLAMLKDPSFAVLSVLSFVMMIFASFYYFKTSNFMPTVGVPDEWISTVMSVGQVFEIGMMFLLAWLYRRLGAKGIITLGLVCWLARFVIFAAYPRAGPVVAAQVLHGACFAFALAATMIYVDRICTPDVRGSMQSFLGWVMGLGTLLGAWVSSAVQDAYTADNVANWSRIWTVPAVGMAVVLVVFVVAFRARDTEEKPVTA